MSERRRFSRVDFEGPVQVAELRGEGHNLLKNSFSRNISQGGMEIVSFDFYPINERVQVKVFSNCYNRLMQGVGKIVWVEQLPNQDKYRIGTEIVELSRSTYQKLKGVVEDSILRNLMINPGETYAN